MPYKSASMHWTISGWDFSRKPKNFICLGPSMDPAMALQYNQHGPLYIGYIFAFYATKIGSRDSGDIKVNPHLVLNPPWSVNGPYI